MIFKYLVFCCLIILGSLSQHLQAQYGYIRFNVNADSVLLIVDLDTENARSISNGTIVQLKPGSHLIQLSTPLGFVRPRDIFINRGDTITFYGKFPESNRIPISNFHMNPSTKSYFGKDGLIVTDSTTKIYQDDELIGTGKALIDLPKDGSSNIKFESPYFGSKSNTFKGESTFQVMEHYRQPKKSTTQALSILPGVSQVYKRQYLKGGVFLATNLISMNFYFNTANEYSREQNRFDELVLQYNATRNEQTAFELGNQIETLQGEIKDLETRKNILFGTTIGIYALNVFDAFRSKPKGGYRTNNFNIEFEIDSDATVRINF